MNCFDFGFDLEVQNSERYKNIIVYLAQFQLSIYNET